MIQYSAIVAAWVGEKDLALAKSGESGTITRFRQLRPTETAALV